MYAAQSLLLLGKLLTSSPGHPVLHSSCDVSNLGRATQESLLPPGLAMTPSHSSDDQATRSFSSQHRPAYMQAVPVFSNEKRASFSHV